MRADLSRGHRPDDKRKQRYRRVLTQQGRLWLDSDVAASVDATDRLIRHLAKDVGCPAGSPDTGYLASPGPAFAWFDSLDHVSGLPAAADPFRAFRDYAVKYLERFPSLYIDARAAAGTLQITGRRSLDATTFEKLRLWMRTAPGAAPLTMVVNGTVVAPQAAIPGGFGFDAHDYDLAAAGIAGPFSDIEIAFASAGASNEAWIGFIEGYNEAALNPLFWVTEGRYYVDGLEVEWAPEVDASAFLEDYAPLPAGTRFVAYIEAWERLITHVEDPGLRDSALGGLDTTVRTRPMGQVKIALVPANALSFEQLVERIGDAFDSLNLGNGRLEVAAAAIPPNPDPCAIPLEGGYNADENRLYRFEVQLGGDLGTATLKWSRNNGSELFAAEVTNQADGLVEISPTPGTAPPMRLLENDIVELITETIDLGDAQRAEIDLSPVSVRPAERRVGRLCFVKSTNDEGVFQLFDLATQAKIDFTAVGAPPEPTRLRKWDGLIASTAAPSVHVIEDGLELTLSGGDFRAGDYWQFEARRLGTNAATPPVLERHGPERLLAPLALFEIQPGAAVPIELEHWFDDRFRPICELRADDIYYDGDKSGTEADTVQEAIDELYELVEKGGGCCDFTLAPSENAGADDTPRVQALVDEIEGRGKICLERGIYNLLGTIIIDGKHVTIEGCPEAIVLATADDGPVFELVEKAGLAIESLVLRATGEHAIIASRKGDSWNAGPNRLAVHLREAWLLHSGTGAVIHDTAISEPEFDLGTDEPWPAVPAPPESNDVFGIHAESSVLAGRCGILVTRTSLVEIVESIVSSTRVGVLCGSPSVAGVVIRDSRITCDWNGPTRDIIAFATPGDLPSQAPIAFEQSPLYEEDSVALAIGASYTEEMAPLRLVASRVIAATAVLGFNQLRPEASHIEATSWVAVFNVLLAIDATETTFASATSAAVHGLLGEVALSRCSVRGVFGLILGLSTDMKNPYPAVILSVRVYECRFSRFSAANPMRGGVLIGGLPDGFGTMPAQIGAQPRLIDIANNLIEVSGSRAAEFAISIAFDRSSDDARSPSVRIHANVVRGRFRTGICAAGARYTISANELALDSRTTGEPLRDHAAIVLFCGARSEITDNVALSFVAEGMELARGITVVGPGDDERHEIVIRGNRVAHDPQGSDTLRPLVVEAPAQMPRFRDLAVEDNDLMGARVDLNHTSDVVVRGNRFDVWRVRIPNGENGIFQDNAARNPKKDGRVDIMGASGTWAVDNNDVGSIYIWPSVWWLAIVVDNWTTFPMTMNRFFAADTPPPVETIAGELTAFFRGITDKSPPVGTVMTPPVTGIEPEVALVNEVSIALGEILDDMVTAFVLAPGWNENVYRVHVSDNVLRDVLVVGRPPVAGPFEGQPAGTPSGSWVQVLGNQAGVAISVNQYDRMLVLHNMAAQLFPPPLGSLTTPVVLHNFNA